MSKVNNSIKIAAVEKILQFTPGITLNDLGAKLGYSIPLKPKTREFLLSELLRHALREWVNDYFQHYLQNKPDWQATLAEQLQALAKILRLEQILKSIPEDCNQLLLVPHRFLHLLPLHALPVQNLQGESHSSELPRQASVSDTLLDCFPGGVSYTPSFQALQLAQRCQRPGFSQFVGVQNPTGDLSYADGEISVVGRRFQPTAEILMGEAAQKDVVSAALQAAHCAHFACHGYFDFESPLKSALVLARGGH